ncbi:MAG: ribose 5-phosphate isomerase B [Ignavibacteriaceae bacterium]|nr:ribose 5-phosphate isomerase B [Ignavibacteriaceae bacterium]
MKLAIGADHAGFELKELLREHLVLRGVEVVDKGNTIYDKLDDYPDYAKAVCFAVNNGEAERGIIICGSGVGACMTANKVKGIRACLCHDTYSARQGVEHDAMNVLCLGARIVGSALAKELVDAFLSVEFSNEERHVRRLNKMKELENN